MFTGSFGISICLLHGLSRAMISERRPGLKKEWGSAGQIVCRLNPIELSSNIRLIFGLWEVLSHCDSAWALPDEGIAATTLTPQTEPG